MSGARDILSICIGHHDRSVIVHGGRRLELLPRCVDTLSTAARELAGNPHKLTCELVIADWPDVPQAWPLAEWLSDRWPFVRTIVRMSGPLNRGAARNAAARAAHGNILFFCDADMLVPAALIHRGVHVAWAGSGFFPLYQRQCYPDGKALVWGTGHGNCIVTREHWEQSGGFPEKQEWGGEDTAFSHWFDTRKLMVREKFPDFIHLWHPGPRRAA